MSQQLYQHYERELHYVRQEAQQFAKEYPAAAGRLLLEANRSVDPHIERLIEAFALLTGRVRQKIDDEFPELTDALLGVLYPHFLAPTPSMGIVKFGLDPSAAQPTGVAVPRQTRVHTEPIDDSRCVYSTCYPVTLWPIEVVSVRFQGLPLEIGAPDGTRSALRIGLKCLGDVQWSDLCLDHLRFHFDGASEATADLYELLFNSALAVEFRERGGKDADARSVIVEADEGLRSVGFDVDEGLLPSRPQSFVGFRLLSEFFSLPRKFHFADVCGWQRLQNGDWSREIEVVVFFKRHPRHLEHEIDDESLLLGCTPVVNLFEKTAEPIALTHRETEYKVVPDVYHPHAAEVYSVEDVRGLDAKSLRTFRPFYSFRHNDPFEADDDGGAYWQTCRRESSRPGDHGSDVFLRLVDLACNPRSYDDEVLVARTLCTNRHLPVRIRQIAQSLRLQVESAVPVHDVRFIGTPTAPRPAPLGNAARWCLVSHLLTNHLSLGNAGEGLETLKEILGLYAFHDGTDSARDAVARQMIDAMTEMSSRRVVGRIAGLHGGLCSGTEVSLNLDEAKLCGVGSFLFASVLERFLGHYVSVNSFSQLVVRTGDDASLLRRFRPRAGTMQLL